MIEGIKIEMTMRRERDEARDPLREQIWAERFAVQAKRIDDTLRDRDALRTALEKANDVVVAATEFMKWYGEPEPEAPWQTFATPSHPSRRRRRGENLLQWLCRDCADELLGMTAICGTRAKVEGR